MDGYDKKYATQVVEDGRCDCRKPLLSDPKRQWKKVAFSKYGPAESVIAERYNYAEFKNSEQMLFCLASDPAENFNVVAEPKHRELVKSLSQKLANAGERVRQKVSE